MKTCVFLMLFVIIGCSSGKIAGPSADIKNSEALLTADGEFQLQDWSSAIIKDCTPQSVIEGGGRGPFLDADILREKLKPSEERTLITTLPFASKISAAEGSPTWTLSASEDQQLTALLSGSRCLIRWKGELIADKTLATQIEVLADFNPARGEIQFESKPRLVHPHLPLLQSHPLPEVLFLALKPDASTSKFISRVTGISEDFLRQRVQWRSPSHQPDWQIRFKGGLKNSALPFTTSSSEALVPAALRESPQSFSVPVMVRIPQPSAETQPATFSFLVTLKTSEALSIRAIAVAEPRQPQNRSDLQMAQDCFFERWDYLIGNSSRSLSAINMETVAKPCMGWSSRLTETLLASTLLRDRFRSLITRDLLRNPESKSVWTPSLLQYLKFQLDQGEDLVLQLDPQRQDPTLLEIYRSQTLLRAELSGRPSLLPVADTLEDVFLKWALNGSQFEPDAVAMILLAAERTGSELQAPYVHWLQQNPTLPPLNAPEIEFALRLRADLRSLVARSARLAERMEWDQWLKREYQNAFRTRGSFSYWIAQLKFLETLGVAFEADNTPLVQQALIAETILQTRWRAAQPEATWKPGDPRQLLQSLLVLLKAFPERGFDWLNGRKRTGLLPKDLTLLEFGNKLTETHLQVWKQRLDAAIVLGVKPSMDRIIQEVWTGKRGFEETFPVWTVDETSRFLSWRDFYASQSYENLGYDLRIQFLTTPQSWTSATGLDPFLPALLQISQEFLRWQPSASFQSLHREILQGIASDPSTLWKSCEQDQIKTRASELPALMRTYRDTFGTQKSALAMGELRALLQDCQLAKSL